MPSLGTSMSLSGGIILAKLSIAAGALHGRTLYLRRDSARAIYDEKRLADQEALYACVYRDGPF